MEVLWVGCSSAAVLDDDVEVVPSTNSGGEGFCCGSFEGCIFVRVSIWCGYARVFMSDPQVYKIR